MKKDELIQRTDKAVADTHNALQLLWDSIIKGQQMQLLKNDQIKAVLDRYEVNYKA